MRTGGRRYEGAYGTAHSTPETSYGALKIASSYLNVAFIVNRQQTYEFWISFRLSGTQH